ncbi:MAG: hypothetical protein JO069_13100 [Verrucomicrobia bacterium]|nr:hypothetical protein [Verrucomicrobiota bacterium]
MARLLQITVAPAEGKRDRIYALDEQGTLGLYRALESGEWVPGGAAGKVALPRRGAGE